MKKRFILTPILMVATLLMGYAQKTITGKVSDTKGEPMIGASVVVKV